MKTNANGCVRARIFLWILSIVLKSWPIRSRCEYGNVCRCVEKRESTRSRRIQDFEKRISENDFTVWKVQKPFEKISGSVLEFSIGNPMQMGILGPLISKIVSICIELPIQNIPEQFWNELWIRVMYSKKIWILEISTIERNSELQIELRVRMFL